MANWFVAFKIDPGNWFQDLLTFLPEGLKNFHPDDIHMTIAFLGNFNVELKSQVVDIIKNFTFEPVTVNSKGLIVLPSQRRFSAICVDFQFLPAEIQMNFLNEPKTRQPPAENQYLQNKFLESINRFKDEIYKAAKVPVDTRSFLPHVTIARPPRKMSFLHREKLLENLKKIQLKEFSVTLSTIALYTWADHRIDFKADTPVARKDARKKQQQFKIVYPGP